MRTAIRTLLHRSLAACLLCAAMPAFAQAPPAAPAPAFEPPDAQRTHQEFNRLLQRFPPEVRGVLQLDHGLLSNEGYLAAYPALASFLRLHPEVGRNPIFYVGEPAPRDQNRNESQAWRDAAEGLEVVLAFACFFVLIGWFIRTLLDYRRWNRQHAVLTEAHNKLLDRLDGNQELLTYIQSPAGSKFLESAPIRVDTGAGGPFGRIVGTVQAGIVVGAAGIGLVIISAGPLGEAATPVHSLGVLLVAVGAGFVISALISFLISRRLGIVEIPAHSRI